jgi:hypothetical protein
MADTVNLSAAGRTFPSWWTVPPPARRRHCQAESKAGSVFPAPSKSAGLSGTCSQSSTSPTISTGPCRPSCRSISSRIDPFDRLIIAQAYLEGTVLGTQDWRMRPYGVVTLHLD